MVGMAGERSGQRHGTGNPHNPNATRIGVIISDEPRINEEIRVPQVRLIGPKGEQVGVIATSVAQNLAREANIDLVEVAPNAKPPVAKLIDYGKFKYNEKIKAREARRNQSTAEIKEIRFRLKIDDHDFEVKKGHVIRFLSGGDKVKVTIMLRGREQSRPIGGVELLRRLAAEVEEYGTIESQPKQEGRNIIMTLAPKGKKVHTQSEQRRRGAESRAERQARQAARLAAKQDAQAKAAAEAKASVEKVEAAAAQAAASKPADPAPAESAQAAPESKAEHDAPKPSAPKPSASHHQSGRGAGRSGSRSGGRSGSRSGHSER